MSIRFGDSIGDLFRTPQKWMTVLLLSVCILIPLVGPIVMQGYLLQRFARVRNGLSEPDFNFDLFGEYLMIGLWPFLASFVLSLAVMPVMFLGYLPMLIGIPFAEDSPGVMLALAALSFVLVFAVMMAMMLFSFPIMLRSGLMMNFGAGFSWSYLKSFVGKVGFSLVGWYLLLVLVLIPASFVGMLALYVGMFVVSAAGMFAMNHLLFQHYDLFLHRGGEPIPVDPRVLGNPTPAEMAPPIPGQTGT